MRDDDLLSHLAAFREELARAGVEQCPVRLTREVAQRLAKGNDPRWAELAAWFGVPVEDADNVICAVLGLTLAIRSELPMYLASKVLNEAPRVPMRIPVAVHIDHNLDQHVDVDPVQPDVLEHFRQRAQYLRSKIYEMGFDDRVARFLEVWTPIDDFQKRARTAARGMIETAPEGPRAQNEQNTSNLPG